MATLTDICFYPLKSCAGIALQEATLTRRGIMHAGIYDREWMLVDAQGRFLTQREVPRMALVVPSLGDGHLEVRAPGMAPLLLPLALPDPAGAIEVQVLLWDEAVPAFDGGDACAAWFTQALGQPCRLVRFPPAVERLASAKWTGGIDAPTLFSDGFPVLLAGAASLDDVNDKLHGAGRSAIPMNRFRPNLVVAGLLPFEEDYCESFEFGDTVLAPVKPCPRCPIPSVDQASGIVGPDPLDVLHYRAKPALDGAICFGMNCIVTAGGDAIVRIGDEIPVNLAF